MSDSVQPHPWDSPGKNTAVGCHFLLQCIKVKSESEVAQSCPTLSDPMDCSLPGSSIHGIFQARVLEWGAIAFSEVEYSIPLLDSTVLEGRDSEGYLTHCSLIFPLPLRDLRPLTQSKYRTFMKFLFMYTAEYYKFSP